MRKIKLVPLMCLLGFIQFSCTSQTKPLAILSLHDYFFDEDTIPNHTSQIISHKEYYLLKNFKMKDKAKIDKYAKEHIDTMYLKNDREYFMFFFTESNNINEELLRECPRELRYKFFEQDANPILEYNWIDGVDVSSTQKVKVTDINTQ